jgi:hypothetical protein
MIRRKIIMLMLVVTSIFILVGSGWSAEVGRPHAIFEGAMATYLNGSDFGLPYDLEFMETTITGVILHDGSSPSDPIIGASVQLTTTRNPLGPGTSFTDGTITISDGSKLYLSATLTNINFTTDGTQWYLNPDLDVNQPETLNMNITVLNENGSAYIHDLAVQLGSNNIAGMQIILDVLDGDITQDSISFMQGLFDGVPVITNTPPVADAGVNIVTISSEQIASTTVMGTASDADGDELECRWIWQEGGNVLRDWTSVINGECPLNLNTLSFGIGTYALTLEVRDGQTTSSDDMLLTIDNSAPHAYPGGGGVFETGTTVTLTGEVSDYDGDLLHYEWLEGTTSLCSGYIQAIAGGTAVVIPDDCAVSNLSGGTHTFTLQVDDGVNLPDSMDVTAEIIDTTAPTIAPLSSNYLLWPPNHIMVNISIEANAVDNSGSPVTLTASVASNEPVDGLGDGDMGPDWTEPVIDQTNGIIYLELRRERSGKGNGRVYTVTITATDGSGNSSTTAENIGVPHDMSRKK